MNTIPLDLMTNFTFSNITERCRFTCSCNVQQLMPTSRHWLVKIFEAPRSSKLVLTLTLTADLAHPPSALQLRRLTYNLAGRVLS